MAKRNLSVEQFQQLMANVPKAISAELQSAVDDAGSSLARAMFFAVPRGKDSRHELAESIRVERGKRPLQVIVKAGGPLTQTDQGTDYAKHVEWGTEKMKAKPFFFSTYRAKKKSLRAQIAKRVKPAIAKVITVR